MRYRCVYINCTWIFKFLRFLQCDSSNRSWLSIFIESKASRKINSVINIGVSFEKSVNERRSEFSNSMHFQVSGWESRRENVGEENFPGVFLFNFLWYNNSAHLWNSSVFSRVSCEAVVVDVVLRTSLDVSFSWWVKTENGIKAEGKWFRY